MNELCSNLTSGQRLLEHLPNGFYSFKTVGKHGYKSEKSASAIPYTGSKMLILIQIFPICLEQYVLLFLCEIYNVKVRKRF